MYYRTYTCISDFTCILRNLYLSYRTYSCVQDLFLSYRSYSGVTELILVFRILFFCEGTRRYDESELNQIQDRTYLDTGVPVGTTELDQRQDLFKDRTYQIQELSDAGLILITNLCAFRTCSYLTDLILVLQNLLLYFRYRSTRRYYRTFYGYKSTRKCYRTDSLYGGTRRYHWTYTYLTDTRVLVGTSDTRVPVGTTGLILNLPIREYP